MTSRSPAIEVVDLGTWGFRAFLVSEYDPECDTIRINARAVEAVRAVLGDGEASRFIACAVEHEAFHRGFPRASEGDARAHADAATGGDAERFARVLRARTARGS